LFGVELLVGGEEGLPGVGAEFGVVGGYVVDGEDGVFVAGEGGPGERKRDGGADASAGGVGGDGGGAALIAEVVEEDAADAGGLGHLGEVEVGVLALHGEDEVVRGGLELGPGEGGLDGRDDVQAFAAGELEEAFDAEVAEALADFGGGGGDGEPGEIGVGVEIEDEAVGVLEVVVGGTPGMDFEDVHLGEGDDGFGGVEGDVGFGGGGGFVLDVDGLDAGRDPGVDVLLEEAGFAGALRAANEREWAVGDVRKDAVGGDGVVVGELLLGEAGSGVEDFVGMGKCWSFADGKCCAHGES